MTNDEIHLTDFRMAGFLLVKGYAFLGTYTNDKEEVVFRFRSDTADPLVAYPGSAEQRYDSACRVMHDMVKVQVRKKRGAT